MRKSIIVFAFLVVPSIGWAAEGLALAEEWVLMRDGAWIINFAVLFTVLYLIVKRYILPLLRNRSEGIAKALAETEKARMGAMKTLADLEYKTRQFEKESEQMRREAVAEGERIREEFKKEATNRSRIILEKAKVKIESEILKARNRLRQDAVEFAMKIAQDLLSEKVEEKDHRKIFEEYLESVEGSK